MKHRNFVTVQFDDSHGQQTTAARATHPICFLSINNQQSKIKNPLLFFRCVVIVLLLNAALASAETITLQPSSGGTFRLKDILGQQYGATFRAAYSYTSANVQVTPDINTEPYLSGTINATGLKPNFAYQIKLLGRPTRSDVNGDDVTNERIGYLGRWWRAQPSPGNSNDTEYNACKNNINYIFQGYLLIAFFVTDEHGNANTHFVGNNSYHVLWRTNQRSRRANDGPLLPVTLPPTAGNSAYDVTLAARAATLYGEWESTRALPGQLQMPLGRYKCTFALTEESFHDSGLYAGCWATALTANCEFNIKLDQTINFAALNPVQYGVAPLTLSATGGASGNLVTFAVTSGPGTITGNTLTVTGAGTIDIGAYQAGNECYNAGQSSQTLTVTPASLTVTADDQTRVFGAINPPLTVTCSGFVNGDTAAQLICPASATTTATSASSVGTYAIVPSGAVSNNYAFTYVNGTLTVTNLTPTAIPQALIIGQGQTVSINLSGVSNDHTTLTFAIAKLPENGTISGTAPQLTYTPNAGFTGADYFTFMARTGTSVSIPATISIWITPPPIFLSLPLASPNPAQVGQLITFQAFPIVINGEATVAWDFGDGTSATGSDVTHTYSTPGDYTVSVTATSPERLTTTAQIPVFVGAPLNDDSNSGDGTVRPPEDTGFSMIISHGRPKTFGYLKVHHAQRSRTRLLCRLTNIKFDASFTQNDLVGQSGTLIIGSGALAQTYSLTLNKKGISRGPKLMDFRLDVKNGYILFKIRRDIALTDLVESLGATSPAHNKLLQIPMTLQIGRQIFVTTTFDFSYTDQGKFGVGLLIKNGG
ncbi:MAG: MBG domain-containing protein [Planctomycetota bacterium]